MKGNWCEPLMACPAQPLFKHSVATREGLRLSIVPLSRRNACGHSPGPGESSQRHFPFWSRCGGGQAFVVLTVTARRSSATTIGGTLKNHRV